MGGGQLGLRSRWPTGTERSEPGDVVVELPALGQHAQFFDE